MADAEPPIAEHLVRALMRAMVREGIVTEDSLLEIADDLDGQGSENAEMAAHLIRWDILRDHIPAGSVTDPDQDRRRRDMLARTRYIEVHGRPPPKTIEEAFEQMRGAPHPDGGNDAT